MGVMTCSRRGCDNIMCDRHSTKHGYLCDSCFEELVDLGTDVRIENFMDTPPNDPQEKEARRAASLSLYDGIFTKRED